MFKTRTMTPQDFTFAVNLTNQKNWNLTKQDFQFMTELDPKGCFLLLDNQEKIGIATTTTYKKTAWFGNLIVKETHRKKGAGTQLVEHALKYLKRKKVETIGLYAYIDKIPFYERLNFKQDSTFTVLTGKGFPSSTSRNVKQAEKQDITKIIELDSACFGDSRKKMLKPILLDTDNLCLIYKENAQILAFTLAKIYRGHAELGPLICKKGRNDIATKLLKAALNKLDKIEISVCAPNRENTVIQTLKQSGFTENSQVARMYHGPAPSKDCIYMAESLERG